MNSAQTVVDDVTEKRRLNPDYQLSLDELRAVDVVVTAQIRASAKLRAGVDLGTSPHGLSAGLADPVQETRKESSFSPPAKPVLILPDAVSTARNVETCQRPKQNRRNGAHRSFIAGAPDPAVLLRTERSGVRQSGTGISPAMNSPQTVVDDVTEKRRLNPDYSLSLAELKAVDVVVTAQIRASAKLRAGVDLGTSPHGLSAGLAEPVQETWKESSFSPHAKPVLILPDAVSTARNEERTEWSGVRQSGTGISPGVYRSPKVRSDCRCIREAAAKQAREGAHYLRLDDREYLHVYAAVEQDRNRTRKAIRKGIADPQDLKATDSIWGILQAVMVRRMKGYAL